MIPNSLKGEIEMKVKSNTMQVYSPQEWDIGNLIRDSSLFDLVRRKLRPETYLRHELKDLVEIMIEHGNSVEEIYKISKEAAVYAMTLCNHVLNWTVQSKCKELEPDKPLSIKEGLENCMPMKYRDSQSYMIFWQATLKLFTDKDKENYQTNKLAFMHAMDMYLSYTSPARR